MITRDRRGGLSLCLVLEGNGGNKTQAGSVKPLSGTKTETVTVITRDRRGVLSLSLVLKLRREQ